MFPRVVAPVLIPLLLLPGLCCAQAHHGISDHDPTGLERSPHFHLRFLLLALPNRDEDLCGSQPVEDHDDDAVYLSISTLLGWHSEHHPDPVAPPTLELPLPTVNLPDAILVFLPAETLPTLAGFWMVCPIYLRSLILLL